MDVVVDSSALVAWASDPFLSDRAIHLLKACGGRLVIPLQGLMESLDGDPGELLQKRAKWLHGLATVSGLRVVFSQDVGDILKIERRRKLHSTPTVPRLEEERWVAALGSEGHWARDRSDVISMIQSAQRKDEFLVRDRRARDAIRPEFKHRWRELPTMLETMRTDDGFWNLVFTESVSKQGRYVRQMRLYPKRYGCAVMAAAYAFLNVAGNFFEHYGSYAHLVCPPRRGDWTDRIIAACSAHARLLITEDKWLRERTNFVARQFGLRLRAGTTASWLACRLQ